MPPLVAQIQDIEVSRIDLVILVAYVVGILFLGYWVGRKKKNAGEYFLTGRTAIWPLIGFALMAANLSGTSYVGLAGAGYDDGIAVWNYEWMATLVLVFFALFILPFYLRSEVDTMPEFLEKRYDRRSRYAFSAFTVFTAMFIDAAGALFAGALVVQVLFPEIPLTWLIIAIALLGGIYVLLGGLTAVMITDMVQGIMLLTIGAVIFFYGFNELGSWAAVREAAPPDGFSVFKPPDDEFLPWPGIFTGVLWLGFYYWTTNHVVVQKVLAAKDVNHGRWGALFAGFMQLPFLFLLILPGTMGREIFPDLEDPDQIWPLLAFDILPIGLRGLALAALVAALMSTLDSVLNGAASLVTNDFIKNIKKDMSDKQLLVTGRIMVGVFMVLAAVWAPQISNFPNIVEYFQSFLGQITMPVVVVFLGGLFWKRSTRHAGFWTLAIGVPLGLALFFSNELLEAIDLQFLYATGVMFVVSLAIYIPVSLLTEAHEESAVKEYVWTRETWREESKDLEGTPFYLNYRYLGLAMVVLTLVMIYIFR